LVATIVASATLAGCGGGSAYCDAVEKNKTTLNTFGHERTNAAYARYAKVFQSVAKQAPKAVAKDWMKLADATLGVISAQKSVGLALEDMTKAANIKKLDTAQLKKLNSAYEAFNGTTVERRAVVKNVKQECKITLK